jgi:hypothetical protein
VAKATLTWTLSYSDGSVIEVDADDAFAAQQASEADAPDNEDHRLQTIVLAEEN